MKTIKYFLILLSLTLCSLECFYIIFQSNYTSKYLGSSGVYTFWTDYGLDENGGFTISDHKLVWAKFVVSGVYDD